MINSQYEKKLKSLFLILFLLPYYSYKSQSIEDYNKVYNKTYLETAQKDFPKALLVADSLFRSSETPRLKAKSLMLSASLLQQSGEIKRAVEFAEQAGNILENTDDHIWKAKISGFMATQYRHLKLTGQSKKYIDQTLQHISMISDGKVVDQTMGFLMQEQAYYEIDNKKFHEAIKSVKSADKFFSSSNQSNGFLTANNHQLLGLSYFHIRDNEKAILHYKKALELLDMMPENYLKALVFEGLANVYINKKDVKNAKLNIEKAQRIAEESQYLNLKKQILSTSQSYYALVKDIEKLQETKIKQDSLVEKMEDKATTFVSDSFTGLQMKNEKIEVEKNLKSWIAFISVIVLTFVIIYFWSYRKRQKRNYNRIKQILKNVDYSKKREAAIKPDMETNIETDLAITVEELKNDTQSLMTPATEQKILNKLDKFEQSNLFTKNNVSLPYLASYCNTNTKYLSYVVNLYKEKDFKNYINELRVNYILERLNDDPQYRKYKISSLATEAGFSSQSKFAAAFRKKTDVSPSEFLKHLKSIK